MTILLRMVHLWKLKDELTEKLKDPSITYTEMTEIMKKMRAINYQIRDIKMESSDINYRRKLEA